MFVISEIFPQHGGNLDVAEQMILQSKMGGASAVKVQLYEANQFGPERAYLELNFEGLKRLKAYADRLNINLFATPFTRERLEWCMNLEMKYLKVPARMHGENPSLAEEILSKQKITFVSIPSDYDVSKIKVQKHAIYLFCIAKYPTLLDETRFPDFNKSIYSGFSDHTVGISAALYASAHGAKYLEKHFTLSYSGQKNTEKAHLGSMTVDDLVQIKNFSSGFELIQGSNIS